MNEWIERSIKLANSPGYLDKLASVYPMNVNLERPLPKDVIPKVKKAFMQRNNIDLVQLLMDNSEVFPVKDSYVGFLRKKPGAIHENPRTIARIAERLYRLGFERLLSEASRPIETNRQIGACFKSWSQKLGYPLVTNPEYFFDSSLKRNEIALLALGDAKLGEFARERLGCKLKKNPDLLVRKGSTYILGEAKFLTTPGGEQNGGFFDAETFINEKSGNATRIAILDGYIWLESLKGIHEKIKQSDDNIMSALLLKDFLGAL